MGVKVGILFINEKPRCWVNDQSKPFDRMQAVVTRIGTQPARGVLPAFNNEARVGVGVLGCLWAASPTLPS